MQLIHRLMFRMWVARQRTVAHVKRGSIALRCLGCSIEENAWVSELNGQFVELACNRVQRDFGTNALSVPINAYVVGSRARLRGLPISLRESPPIQGTRGCWVPTLGVIILRAQSPAKMMRSVIHELVHAVLDRCGCVGSLPPAICEGYAMLLEDRYSQQHGGLRMSWAKKGYTVSRSRRHVYPYGKLCRITASEVAGMGRYESAVFYAQSLLLTDFILNCGSGHGTGILQRLRDHRVSMSEDPGMAIATVCGMEAKEFEEGYWRFADELASS